jgi:ABC-type antimicrobial peptide transport system permease subunit
MFYLPMEQMYPTPATLFVHTDVEPSSLASAVRAEIAAVDPNVPLYDLKTMDRHLNDGSAFGLVALAALMVGTFGTVGLALASIGLYGVISFSVNQRLHEIGVRMALGANSGRVLKMVVRQGMLIAGIGLGIGLLLALLVSQAIGTLLLGVSPTDALTYAVVIAFLIVIALLASYLPARRATRVDPLVALRSE